MLSTLTVRRSNPYSTINNRDCSIGAVSVCFIPGKLSRFSIREFREFREFRERIPALNSLISLNSLGSLSQRHSERSVGISKWHEIATSDDVLLAMTDGTPLQRRKVAINHCPRPRFGSWVSLVSFVCPSIHFSYVNGWMDKNEPTPRQKCQQWIVLIVHSIAAIFC